MKKIFLLLSVIVVVTSCKKSTEELTYPSISDYAPLEVGKYVTYAMDSLVYINFGGSLVTRSYEVKYMVDAQIIDNLNRPAYRVLRFIRINDTQPWVSDATFEAVNTGTSFEFVENNERYIKLKSPIRNGFSWKGNSFIDTYSLNSPKRYLDDWDYIYDSVDAPLTLGTFNLEKTLKVDQRDEIVGNPDDPGSYSEINYSMEKYARGIGMVYRRFFHNEYQPGGGFFADGSYGVTYTMIDHN
jgi:hypothetical protein